MDESGFRAMFAAAAVQSGCLAEIEIDLDSYAPQWVAEDLPRVHMLHLRRLCVEVFSSGGPWPPVILDGTLAALAASTASLPRLRDITLRNIEYLEPLSEALGNGSSLPQLGRLMLNGFFVNLASRSLSHLMRRLSFLDLNDVEGLDVVNDLEELLSVEGGVPSPLFPQLSDLLWRNCGLPAEAGAVLGAAGAHFPALERLVLTGNDLKSEGLLDLAKKAAEIGGFPKLKHLGVELKPNDEGASEAMAALTAAFPGVEVEVE